jgi:hypothetical protein
VIDFTGWLFQGQAQLSDSMPYSVQGWRASLPRLAITVGAFDAVAAAMGASEDNASWSVLQSTAANWGQLDAHVTNIPEPASSMLFGLGLLGLCQVRRR